MLHARTIMLYILSSVLFPSYTQLLDMSQQLLQVPFSRLSVCGRPSPILRSLFSRSPGIRSITVHMRCHYTTPTPLCEILSIRFISRHTIIRHVTTTIMSQLFPDTQLCHKRKYLPSSAVDCRCRSRRRRSSPFDH